LSASKVHQDFAHKILTFIASNDNFLISSHMNSDGDAIASALAVHMLLTKLNKKSVLVFHDQKIDNRFDYLAEYKNIISYKKDLDLSEHLTDGKIENAIILDVPGYGRLGDVAEILPGKDHLIKIDHHPCEDVMGIIDWVDVDASSTTVLVHEVIEASGQTIDLSLADAIFTGIVYDTGRVFFLKKKPTQLYFFYKIFFMIPGVFLFPTLPHAIYMFALKWLILV
jgi:phosphoesterase RecJ-like protein